MPRSPSQPANTLLVIQAFLLVVALLVLGVAIRQSIPGLRSLFVPASVIAGFVGLMLVQSARWMPKEAAAMLWLDSVSSLLSGWPSFLIAVVFAGMLLQPSETPRAGGLISVGRQGLMAWIIILGQAAVGLLATWLLIQPLSDVPNSFGMLIETGFAGGHGTAAAMGDVFANPEIGLASGRDLGMLMATGGLVFGVVSGIVWINVGSRLGWYESQAVEGEALGESSIDPVEQKHPPIGYARIGGEVVDPLLLQAMWLALALAVGLAAQAMVVWFAETLRPDETQVVVDQARQQLDQRLSLANIIGDLPLFIYTLFGGWFVRLVMTRIGILDRIDAATIGRLSAAAMDLLVVAAITTLNLKAVAALLLPFSIIFVCGCLWAMLCLCILAPRILPRRYWFPLALINYGMSTGTTATGFVLLRVIDPKLRSGAAEDYALAAPLTAPFIGGGMITVALPLLLLERVPIAVPSLVLSVVVAALVIVAMRIARNSE